MYSIRTKSALLTVCAIIVSMTVSTVFGVAAIKNIGDSSSHQILRLLCETGEKNLDAYFGSVEQSVEMVAAFVESDLQSTDADALESHISRVSQIFRRTAYRTNGVLTFYYRIDPALSESVKGFWYVRTEEDTFREHEVTDISFMTRRTRQN